MGWIDIAYGLYNANQNSGGSSRSSGSSSSSSNASGGGWGSFWDAMLGGAAAWADAEDREDSENNQGRNSRELARTTGQESRRTAEYTSGLADYYRRKQLEERRDGMSNFGQFARQQFTQTYTPPRVGAAPTAADYEMNSMKPTTAGGLAGVARGG